MALGVLERYFHRARGATMAPDPDDDFWEPTRAQVWRRDFVEHAVERARSELASLDAAEAFALAERRLATTRRPTMRDELARFAIARAALELASARGPSEVGRAHAFHGEAARCLRRVGIGRRGSRLSGLHDALEETARRTIPDGSAPWEWSRGRSEPARGLFDGGPEVALRLLEGAVAGATSLDLSAARVLRLSGRFEEAERRLDRVNDAGSRERIAWERASIAAMKTGSPDAILRAIRTGELSRTPARMLELFLWTRAAASKSFLQSLPAASSLRRSAGDAVKDEPLAWQVALALERAYKTVLPLPARVADVLRVMDRADRIADPSLLMLSVAACARWLLRFKQTEAFLRLASRYRALCLSASDGTSGDVFGLALIDEATHPPASAPRPDVDGREGSLLRLAFELLRARAKRVTHSEDERAEAYAELAAFYTSALKGPLMKLGQVLSFYGAPLPQESQRLLATLQDDAAPLPFATLHATIEAELRRRSEEIFAEIDPEPLSSGSVGQVHQGRLRTGERVVVKVQYPDILARMERDFRALKLLLPLASPFFPGWDLRGIAEEVRARMILECDYVHEARWQARFRERLADEQRIVIPRVFAQLSTARVLVTEYFDGQTFAEFAATASQAARNEAGETLLRYAIRTTIVDRSFNTDMHPGNLLFADGRMCVVDFGNVREWTDASAHGWREILSGALHDDPGRIAAALRTLETIPGGSHEDYHRASKLLTSFLLTVVTDDQPRRISKATMLAEMRALVPSSEGIPGLQIPPAYVYAFRMYWGMFAILADLGAEVRFRRISLETLGE